MIPLNAVSRHLVTIRVDAAGRFTAQAVGLPHVCATAATREAAIAKVQAILHTMLASGDLTSVDVPLENSLLQWAGRRDPNDPEEQAFLAELARAKQEDLEQTLRELDQECSNSSSTPTT